MEKVKTVLINGVVFAICAILLIWGNTLYRQHVQFDKGEAAAAAGDFTGAVAGYEAAIHMYTPGSRLVSESEQRLWALGLAYEQKGDVQRALIAYRSLRSSIYGIASLWSPGEEWIARCDRKIAQLVPREQQLRP